MYCVIYEFKVKPETEESFREAWHQITEEIIDECGSLGARLHKSEEGTWIAYAQWADRESWQVGHKIVEERSIALHVDNCLEEIPVVLRSLMLIDDLLISAKPL